MDGLTETINSAFAGDGMLRKRIFDAINETPQRASLFADIARYHLDRSRLTVVSNGTTANGDAPPAKKRRIDENSNASIDTKSQPREVILEVKDVSFSLPQRKKFHLNIVQYGRDFNEPSTSFALCARNPATNQVEFEYNTKDISYALRMPVPEKAQKQYNFTLLPSTQQAGASPLGTGEGIIYTVNHGPLKSYHIHSTDLQQLIGDAEILETCLNTILQRTGSKLVLPTESEFACAVPEAHRKNEKAYHVKAHRGSKDGYLFFLENGIFFGFRKPLAFFPFHEIESVSYTNVLQRTFNLVVTIKVNLEAEAQEVEFSMLDQAEFAGIDAYIKKHHLQDASLAEARRAKQYKVNGKSTEVETKDDDGRTELERAEAELQDEEDEMEEDYDPGSDDDSEGSAYSEEDDDGPVKKRSGNLVQEELGSEAEDVEITEDEDEGEDEDEDEQNDEEDSREDSIKVEADSTAEPMVKQSSAAVVAPVLHDPGAPDYDDDDQL